MPATVTITGKAGAGLSITAKPFTDVNEILIDATKNMITLFRAGETVSPIDVGPATVVTATKSGNNWTLVIS